MLVGPVEWDMLIKGLSFLAHKLKPNVDNSMGIAETRS